MFGSGYVIEHVVAEHNIRTHQENYMTYMSDVLMAIGKQVGVNVPSRFSDLDSKQVSEEKSGDEIALEVIQKAGLKVTSE